MKVFGAAGAVSIGYFLLFGGGAALILTLLLLWADASFFTITVVDLIVLFLAGAKAVAVYSTLKRQESAETVAFDEDAFWREWTDEQNAKYGLPPLYGSEVQSEAKPKVIAAPSAMQKLREHTILQLMQERGITREGAEKELRKHGL